MKTVTNNPATEKFEFAKRVLDSFEVLIIGVLFVALFIIGINTNYGSLPGKETSINQPHQVNPANASAKVTTLLSDKNS